MHGMARPLRVLVKDGWYHVTARGNRRQTVFCHDTDRRRFLGLVGELPDRFRVEVHAFVLMDNHYHLVVRTPEANLSQAMRWLHVSYSMRWNWAHGLCGHVFQGRFKAILIEATERVAAVVRYVHLNPVRVEGLGLGKGQQRAARVVGCREADAELVRRRLQVLREYRWSSWQVYGGAQRAPSWLETSVVAGGCGGRSRAEQQRALVEYTEAPLRLGRREEPWEGMIGGTILGSSAFAQRVLSRQRKTRTRPGQESAVRRSGRLGWAQICRKVEQVLGRPWQEMMKSYGDWGRDGAIHVAVRYGGYRLAEVVAELGGIEYGTAAQGVRRFERRTQKEKSLQQFVLRMRRELAGSKPC